MAKRRANNEGGLFQRQSGRHKGKWVARVPVGTNPNGHAIYKDFLFKTQAAAKEKIRESLEGLRKGRVPITKSPTLGTFIENWLENRVKPSRSPNTHARYKSAYDAHIKPDVLATLPLKDIRISQINDFFGRKAADGTPNPTIIHVRSVLSAAMSQAVKEELMHENPVRKSDPPRKPDRQLKYLDPLQVRVLAESLKGKEPEALIMMAIFTGMRMSELLGLSWSDIDFDQGRVTIGRQLLRSGMKFTLAPLKTKSSRRNLPLSSSVLEMLKALKGSQVLNPALEKPAIPNLVFVSATGQPMHRKTVLDLTNAELKAAGLPAVGFHALRHTCASLLINAGANPLQVQRQLGHSSVRLTLDVYSHLFPEMLDSNVAILDRFLSP